MRKGISFLLKYCWRIKKEYIICLITLQIVNCSVTLLGVVVPKYIIDELLGTRNYAALITWICILVIGALVGNTFSNWLQTQSFLYKGMISSRFEIDLGEKLAQADFEKLEDSHYLDVKERAYKFLYGDGQGFATVLDNFFGIIGKMLTFLGIITVLATLNIWVVCIFIILVLLSSLVDSQYKKANVKLDLEKAPLERRVYYLSGILDDFTYGKEIRLGNLQDWLISKYKVHLDKTLEFYQRSIINTRKSLLFSSLMSGIQQLITYGYLVWKTISGESSLGDFTMHMNAVNLFTSAMQDVMRSVIEIAKYSQYYQAVEEYMNVPSNMRQGTMKLPDRKDKWVIEFEHVWFKYLGQEEYVLKDINLTLCDGEKYSLVGENGAGKTTLIKLLMRLYDPTKGRILINGVDIKELDYDSYLAIFSAVFQDFKLFSFSLKENVIQKETDVIADKKVHDLLMQVGMAERLRTLAKGIHTMVFKNFDQDGFEPSGGEGQKIALARAAAKKADIIILDEPTAALDARAEHDLCKC